MTFFLANSLCTDPVGQVYISSHGVYRGVFKKREEFVKKLIKSEAFEVLVTRGLFVGMRSSKVQLPGYRLVIESEMMPFDTPCHYFDRRTLLKCVLVWLEANALLLQKGYSLGDCHFGNFMLSGKNQAKLIDLGSIHDKPILREHEGFPLMDLFFKEMLSPVLVMYLRKKYARLARLVIEDAPINGPLNAQEDAVADLTEFVRDEISMLKEKVSRCNDIEAIQVLVNYLKSLLDVPVNDQKRVVSLPYLDKLDAFRESVLCIGSELFEGVEGHCNNSKITVMDWDVDQLERVGREIEHEAFDSENRVSLLFAHPLNRKFIAQGLSASCVVSHMPFDRLWHHSAVMNENIALVLSSLAKDFLIVSVKPENNQPINLLSVYFVNLEVLCASDEVIWYVCAKNSLKGGRCNEF